MQITSHGAAQVVTGSCHKVDTQAASFLVDCGMFQGGKELNRRNYEPFAFDPAQLDFVIVTHGHIDHCGLLPKLIKNGFSGPIYASSATADLLPIMLNDAAYIQEMDTEHENRRRARKGQPPRDPLYTLEDAAKIPGMVKALNYKEMFSPMEGIRFQLLDAGHVIGSSIIELFLEEQGKSHKIVFSGDLGQNDVPIIEDPSTIGWADYAFIESTYGDRLHDKRQPREEELKDVIVKTLSRGGKVLIPSFALERTQELLYSISELLSQDDSIPRVPVYLDSPLAIKITEVFKNHPETYDAAARARRDNPFSFPLLQCTTTREQSQEITKSKKPCIVIAGSGMCTAGRIRHHIRHGIENPLNTLLFVGYQASGSLGRVILEGKKEIRMMGRQFTVKAEIRKIGSFSAHADRDGLTQWLQIFSRKPKKLFLVHGEGKAIDKFAAHLKQKGFETVIPVQDKPLF